MENHFADPGAWLAYGTHMAYLLVKLLTAVILGAVIGYERERAGKPAGLRTNILVALSTCTFVIACTGLGGDAVSRVIQGIVTGIGFLGAGTILKTSSDSQVKGLTTAAAVWMTAAIGVACGLGELGVAIMATLLAMFVLLFVRRFENKNSERSKS
jgi:putative Mg2+ transporter-C (MgtC) family protein